MRIIYLHNIISVHQNEFKHSKIKNNVKYKR
jgi:hypothetical protein